MHAAGDYGQADSAWRSESANGDETGIHERRVAADSPPTVMEWRREALMPSRAGNDCTPQATMVKLIQLGEANLPTEMRPVSMRENIKMDFRVYGNFLLDKPICVCYTNLICHVH